MGLDVVELILAIEESFHVSISDEEAGNLVTVGDIHRLVLSKLSIRDSKSCLTSAAFYRTRRALVDTLGVARHDIRPGTPLHLMLPLENRRQIWSRIREQTKFELPELRLPDPTIWSLLALGVIVAVAAGLYFGFSGSWLALIGLAGIFTGGLFVKGASHFAVEFPRGSTTVGDLSRDVLALNYAYFARETGNTTKADSWEALHRLIHEETGVPLHEIRPDARIVDDLRLD